MAELLSGERPAMDFAFLGGDTPATAYGAPRLA